MSDKPPNFVNTLSNGIQDIAALLPLLGTEQCERHVGSALQKVLLYAAVAPLSIFGNLGVVKAVFATLLATITYPFYGGRWPKDAAFITPVSVLSTMTIARDTGSYGVEVVLESLMEEQHIDDVKGFAWSGWKRENTAEIGHRDQTGEESGESGDFGNALLERIFFGGI